MAVTKASNEVANLASFLKSEGVELTSSEEQILIPLLISFRKEHRLWERMGRPLNKRNKLDMVSERIGEIVNYDRKSNLVNLVLRWHG